MGLTSPESNAELELAQAMKLLAVQESRRPTDVLSGMSASRSISESFMRIMKPDLELRLAFQRGLSEEELKTADQPTAGTATVEPNQPPSGQSHEGTRAA